MRAETCRDGDTMLLTVERREKTSSSATGDADAIRVARLRADAQRPISVNLAEGIALSHALMRFVGAARRA